MMKKKKKGFIKSLESSLTQFEMDIRNKRPFESGLNKKPISLRKRLKRIL